MQRIYLDHNATTPPHPAVLEAMLPHLGTEFGNPSSAHYFGQRARQAIEGAREAVAALVGARSSEIVFTCGGTEADNAAIFGVMSHALRAQGKSAGAPPHLITTTIEHDAVLNACRFLECRSASVTYVPVGGAGVISPDAIRSAIRPETILISVMHANNEIGTVQPIEEIGKIAAEARIRFHTDAVQSAGKVPIDVKRLGVDLLSLSAHKFYGPKGAGALFIRKGVEIDPLLYGGPNERGRRAGTENAAAIVGLGRPTVEGVEGIGRVDDLWVGLVAVRVRASGRSEASEIVVRVGRGRRRCRRASRPGAGRGSYGGQASDVVIVVAGGRCAVDLAVARRAGRVRGGSAIDLATGGLYLRARP